MDITIRPGKLSGAISVIPSKSQAHRLLICASFAHTPTKLYCAETSRDMDATAVCLNALGAEIRRTEYGYHVTPVCDIPTAAALPCHDSGSTLRFMLPIVGALGVDATFVLEGRLPQRPLSPLWEEMKRMGCTLSRPTNHTIRCQGKLRSGLYQIDGGISSQFITGLLLALPLLPDDSQLDITGKLESKPYVNMTIQALNVFGVPIYGGRIPGGRKFRSPGSLTVEGDWSNAAFFLTAKALGSDLAVGNLNPNSAQGDMAIRELLPMMEKRIFISVADIPDLVPILSVYAACQNGAVFTDIQRLRLKESDRVCSTIAMIENLGGKAEATESVLIIHGTGLAGGTVDSVNDHRIAMAAAMASTACKKNVTILGAECVEKSYPRFWEEFRRLGGQYEQYLR